ncbi:Fanconi anemia group M protein [Eupeodes corollae]|uniref:Fanconi anemia group M protein n=1 Tax=Eupeodes corollae TaxID=290404 RepID=UPI002492EEFA|nr:Fanconi anemia group M protein [Eupeodes corollae]
MAGDDNDNIQESNCTGAGVSGWGDKLDDEDNEDLLLLNDELNLNTCSLRTDEKYKGFNNNVAENWIYPLNMPERAYQYNIVQKALFHNTLVVLPTGLGKTFIAAVVMYNMYRWYPSGKVLFMAPTRPLVAQQIDACCKIMGIPKSDCVEITGKLNKASRAELWQSKRCFFATPQSVQSDILDAELNFPFQAIKLIVVDEAHKARGRYAYTEVVRYIWSKNKFFRVLALSATPGRRKEDVEEVIRNLFISNLEVRTEDCVDVVSYVHKRQLKVVVVDLGTKLSRIRDELLEIADPHIRNLIENRLISGRPGSISRNWLVMEHKRFREMTQNNGVPYQKELNSDFNICISVYHAIELLERHGLRVFLNNFDESQDNGPKFVVILRPDLRRLVQRVRDEAGPNPFEFSDQCMVDGQIAPIPPNIDFGHPKFEIAREHVLAHFESNKEGRVIIFCEYRESVMLMHRLLLQHRPLIRPRLFVGQGGSGSIRAVTQKQQISVMNDFKSGKSNALIATSVAEEGIDVGEVDLIVCFDINTSNPTRFIQRIGRTGRKKEGKVLLLATEGKEHSILKDVLSERNRLNKSISRGGQFNSAFYNYAPRMVPTEFNPKCLKVFLQPQQTEVQPKAKDKLVKSTKGNKFSQISQKKDLRHFFKQKAPLDEEDKAVFADTRDSNKITPKASKNKQFSGAIPSATKNVTPPPPLVEPDDMIPISFPLPPKKTTINNKIIKKMAKYIRNSTNGQPMETVKALGSNKLQTESLKYLIEQSPHILPDIWTRMQEFWLKGIDKDNIPSKGITNEDRKIIRAYVQIENSVGSKEAVAELIESKRKLPILPSHSNLTKKHQSLFDNMQHGGIFQNNLEFLVEKFDKLSSQFPSDEFSNDSYVKSMVYEDEIDQSTSIFDESNRNYSNDYALDSKYMSQWGDATNQSRNSLCVLQSPALNTSNVSDKVKPSAICDASKDESDDDVVFVGTTHQSTPIRTGSHKQLLLNFSETPITSSAKKRVSHTKKSQKNILHFTKSNKFPSSPSVCSKNVSAQWTSKSPAKKDMNTIKLFDNAISTRCTSIGPEKEDKDAIKACDNDISVQCKSKGSEDKTINFFDDQFDDLIAANCGVIERIENSNLVKPCSEMPSRSSTVSSLNNNDSTPNDITSLPDVTKGKLTNDSTAVVSTTAANTRAQYKYLKDDQTAVESETRSCEFVHPELADIDINDLSEFSIDEIEESVKTNSAAATPAIPHTISPDIFDELCEPISENKANENSPLKLITTAPPTEVSPCLVSKKALTWGEIRKKYIKPSLAEASNIVMPSQRNENDKVIKLESKNIGRREDHPNESLINMPTKIRSKRRIITSDTDSSDDKEFSPLRKKRTQLESNKELIRRGLSKNARLAQKRANEFIDDEAVLSGSATEDELELTLGGYIQDSVVVNDDEAEHESSIPMTGIYLQSVRSPCGNIRGAFKIPERRTYNDASKIFSQRLPQDNGSYVADSFVVISDDESEVDRSMCPLERAEEILRMKRRKKRKAMQEEVPQPAKKKRVLRIHNSSEDDDDFV